MIKRFILSACLFLVAWGAPTAVMAQAQEPDLRIHPNAMVYLGAFRLPEYEDLGWTYGGNALAYYPGGDPTGAADGYPGSLFGTGNEQQLFVSEISIPAPVISPTRNLAELPTATTLQPFTDVFAHLIGYIEQPRAGLTYLPAQTGQDQGKIHFCYGLHLQDTAFESSHGWFNTDLSNPQTAGAWVFDGYTGYITNDYLCDIPTEWADMYTPGQYLATGRAREGPWAGGGPGLFAYGPWNDGAPPAPGSVLTSLTPLLIYGTQVPGNPELSFDSSTQAWSRYADSDRWRGLAWMTADTRGAVVFSGTKALGESWYGFANGTRWDYECGQPGHPACPEVPDYPYDNRGYWADDFQAQLLFFDPADLAQVAQGLRDTWSVEPYAYMDLSPYFFDPVYDEQDLIKYRRDFVGAITFDRDRGLLYVVEQVIEDDGRGIIHVFQVGPAVVEE